MARHTILCIKDILENKIMLMIIEGNRIKHNFNMAKSKCSLIIREGINYVMGYPLGNDLLTYNEFIDEISKSTSINYIDL
jgi:hypothetical protein